MFTSSQTTVQKQLNSTVRNSRRRFLQLESLEQRSLMAITGLSVVSNVLYLTCDDAADTVTVYKSGTYTIVQHTAGGVTNNYNVGPTVGRLEIRTGGGNDTVNNLTPMNALIYGGAGDDRLNGGGVDDAIFGEAGNDVIYGGGGWDALRGGLGNDSLYGDDGNDRLFGEEGTDYLSGGAGDDFLDAGSAAENNANGGTGNDFNAWVTTVNGASFNDISQGISNNCFILASMGDAAQNGVNLASRITYGGNGNYSVSLFRRNMNGTYSSTAVSVYFDGTLKSTDPTAHFRGQEGESWPIIVNRALAQLLNVNLDTTRGGYAGDVLGAILGKAPATTTWKDASGTQSMYYPDGVLDYLFAVGNSRPTVVATTGAAALDTSLFAGDHVYMVHSVIISGYSFNPSIMMNVPQYTVLLYNPHGVDNRNFGKTGARASGDNSDGLIAITGAEFKRSFAEITTI